MKIVAQIIKPHHAKPKNGLAESNDHIRWGKKTFLFPITSPTSLTFGFLCITTLAFGQPTVKVEVSADTIKPGDLVEVTYTIENGEGRFEAPDFQMLPVVSGPNTSSSFMIQNGKKSSSQSYSYILRGQEEGKMVIPEAFFRDGEQELKIDSVQIMVLAGSNSMQGNKTDTKSSKATREKKKF